MNAERMSGTIVHAFASFFRRHHPPRKDNKSNDHRYKATKQNGFIVSSYSHQLREPLLIGLFEYYTQ
jgi:hypothetical protein